MRVLDVGCGPAKTPDAVGIDRHAYPGVDVVWNLDETPWPLEADSFDQVVASHVIEHVASIPDFMREVHRVARPGATLVVTTPHYSSNDSWQDPTHRWHLGTRWHETFCEHYLAAQMPRFELISVNVAFSRSLRNLPTRLLVRLRGIDRWEKTRAFRSPAKNMTTRLRIVKPQR